MIRIACLFGLWLGVAAAPCASGPRLLSDEQVIFGWRITELETRTKQLVAAEQALAKRQAVVEAQVEILSRRSGTDQFSGISERLARLESSNEINRWLLQAIVLAVIAHVAGSLWKLITNARNGNGNGKSGHQA